jgi:putative toxin-antitoxin system antitoxin component (TIGR02293 family)
MSSVFQVAELPLAKVVAIIRAGLPAKTFGEVATALGISESTLAAKLGLARRTIGRKKSQAQTLTPGESEKLIRAARIHNIARSLFTADEAVSEWLATPAEPLGDVAPIDLLDNDAGARAVEGFIRGLAYGNFQ